MNGAQIRRHAKPVAILVMAIFVSISLFPSGQGHPDRVFASIRVYLGYADDQQAPLKFFPNPWDGSPNVLFMGAKTFFGEPPAFYDAGAIRIDNMEVQI